MKKSRLDQYILKLCEEKKSLEKESHERVHGKGRELVRIGLIHDRIRLLEDALERIRKGTYGICETCRKELSAERLNACPEATRCLVCCAKDERVRNN